MNVKFASWGNSIALRVPRAMIEELGVSDGMEAKAMVRDGQLVVTPNRVPKYDLDALLSEMTEDNIHDEALTGDAVGFEFG